MIDPLFLNQETWSAIERAMRLSISNIYPGSGTRVILENIVTGNALPSTIEYLAQLSQY